MIESSRLPFRKHVCHTVPLIPTICFSSEGGLAMMAPKARKLLSADALFGMLGTGYFSSQQIHCASCLEMHHRNGTVTYHHQMLSAALVHPDKREVIPLMPEPIIKQDGADKNDCERNAAKRLIAKLRQDHPHLKVIVTEDSLSSNAPHIEVLQAHHLY